MVEAPPVGDANDGSRAFSRIQGSMAAYLRHLQHVRCASSVPGKLLELMLETVPPAKLTGSACAGDRCA